MKQIEVVTARPIELIRTDAANYFSGYASVIYDGTAATEYKPLPNVKERISRQAFDEVLQSGQPIEAWYNHSAEHVLGSTATQTLFLEMDERGLKFTIPFDETDPDHVKVRSKLKKGIATGASFQAYAQSTLTKEGGFYIRTIEKIDALKEISIVNHPAYKATEALVRSCHDWEETYQRILRARSL